MKKPTKAAENKVAKLQHLAFTSHQVQSALDEIPGSTLHNRAIIQFLVSALVEKADDAYDAEYFHVYNEMSPRQKAEHERERRARERAEENGAYEGGT